MNRRLLGSLTVAVLTLVAASAVPAGAQMPDPRLMSGQTIPSPELATGTVTVRVIRQTIMNVVAGADVELHGAGSVRHATTGPEGRAEFSGLPAGARVQAIAVVDGERLTSIEFEVPASGGVRTLLAAGVGVGTMVGGAQPGQPVQPAQPAQPIQPGQPVFSGDTRFVIEFQDDTLAVFYLLDLVNPGSGPATLDAPLVIDLPVGVSGAAVLEGGSPLATLQGGRVTIAGPLPPGVTSVPIAYRVESWDETWRLEQAFPLPIENVAIALQRLGEMRLESAAAPTVRDATLQGMPFTMATGASLPVGTPLRLALRGLPHKSRMPVYVTLALSSALVLWGLWMSTSAPRTVETTGAARGRDLEARRDRGLAALAALERRRAARELDEADYLGRRRALIEDLERVYSEVDDRGGAPGGGQGLAA